MIQSRGILDNIFQRGFARTSEFLLKWKFSGPWLDPDSCFSSAKGWPAPKNLFFYSTHSSWNDPMAAAYLAVIKMKLKTIAPIEASQLTRYRSLQKVGLFPVEKGEGPHIEKQIADFRKASPDTAIWITPQGAFAPNELAQPQFKSGLSRWSNFEGARRIPVVMHYHIGASSKPGLFFRVGTPVEGGPWGVKEDCERLRSALERETRTLLQRVWAANSGHRFDSGLFERL